MQKTDIAQALLNVGLKTRVPDIDKLTRNSIRMSTQPVEEKTLPIGISKIGGHADLPRNMTWPAFQGQAQAFLAQIRLADLQPFDSDKLLPTQGMLWFFYDANQQTFGEQPEDRQAWSVFYAEPSSADLQRLPTPEKLPPASLFPACALTFSQELTLALQPDLELPASSWSDKDQEAYEQALDMLQSPAERTQPRHRLLGYPDTIQDDMRIQCQLVSHGVTDADDPRAEELAKGASDWVLLCQIDSDVSAHMRWANNGMIYYWIKRADLQARQFERSWLILQSE